MFNCFFIWFVLKLFCIISIKLDAEFYFSQPTLSRRDLFCAGRAYLRDDAIPASSRSKFGAEGSSFIVPSSVTCLLIVC